MAKTIKVKLLVSRSGPAGAASPGDVIEVSLAEARRMEQAGQIAPLGNAARKAETTAKPDAGVEKARGGK